MATTPWTVCQRAAANGQMALQFPRNSVAQMAKPGPDGAACQTGWQRLNKQIANGMNLEFRKKRATLLPGSLHLGVS
jgi:hypothetical protein